MRPKRSMITGVDQVKLKHRPRLLGDNGPAYLSGELREYLSERKMAHTRGAPYHPQTQGKIERHHRRMKTLDSSPFPLRYGLARERYAEVFERASQRGEIAKGIDADVSFFALYGGDPDLAPVRTEDLSQTTRGALLRADRGRHRA